MPWYYWIIVIGFVLHSKSELDNTTKSSGVQICVDVCAEPELCSAHPPKKRYLTCSAGNSGSTSVLDSRRMYRCETISDCEGLRGIRKRGGTKGKAGAGRQDKPTLKPTVQTTPKQKRKKECPLKHVGFNNSCYYFTVIPETWEKSREICLEKSADLVKVDNRQEDMFIVEQLKKLQFDVYISGHWTGGQYVDRKWVWTDNSSITYSRWSPGEPDQVEKQKYIAYLRPGQWGSKFQWASEGLKGCPICESPKQ